MNYTKGEWGVRGILPIGFHVYSKSTNNPIAVGIENKANAERIVKAVNSYDAMYEALKGVVDELSECRFPDLLEESLKALAKAEGK
ncbi:hypothetical protein LCGC14_0970920 [marine sediment metagenome]|uniref:Uncharacterized protein n=1 Tax=marine sediment metagenome TaxID=412755 RepID=A0A0F9NG57_9ZZZZ